MDVRDLLIGDQEWHFLLEAVLRTTLMFILVLALFMATGKKEVRQFSVLELLVIIGLGSAIGDPMLHPDTPLLPALVSIAVVLVLYRVVNWWTNRSRRMGRIIEGEVRTLFSNGTIHLAALRKEGMSVDEFFGDLRVQHVEHLGQVKSAHMEVDGELSVFFHPREAVRPGLPIAPRGPEEDGAPPWTPNAHMSCAHCGYTLAVERVPGACPHCAAQRWKPALASPRVE